jgi:hypothetical protein
VPCVTEIGLICANPGVKIINRIGTFFFKGKAGAGKAESFQGTLKRVQRAFIGGCYRRVADQPLGKVQWIREWASHG